MIFTIPSQSKNLIPDSSNVSLKKQVQTNIFFYWCTGVISHWICFLEFSLYTSLYTKLLVSPRPKLKHNCLFTWLLSIFTLNIFLCQYLELEIKAFLVTSGRQACFVPRTGFPQEKDKYRKMTAMKLLLITTHHF